MAEPIHGLDESTERRVVAGPSWRSVHEWRGAFRDYANGNGTPDEATKITVKHFLDEKHEGMSVSMILDEQQESGIDNVSLKPLRKEFINWLTLEEPWKISEMRMVAGEILFNENNQKSPRLLKFLDDRFRAKDFGGLAGQMEEHELDKDYVVSEYLKWLSASDNVGIDKETLRAMAQLADRVTVGGIVRSDKVDFTSFRELPREFADKEKKGESSISLRVDEKQMERSLDSVDRKLVTDFVEAFGSGKVSEVTLYTKGATGAKAIDTVGLTLNEDGQERKISVSAILLRTALKGVGIYRENNMDDPTGILFTANGQYIDPETKPDLAKSILEKVNIDGKSLTKDFNVTFAPASKINTF